MYHATATVLQPLDKLQDRILRQTGVTQLEALEEFNLAPLATRRDMAMLGLLHRAALKKGPEQLQELFPLQDTTGVHNTRLEGRRRQHGRQLKDRRGSTHLNAVRRSAFGLVSVYNLLPRTVVQHETVKAFQQSLAELLKERATVGCKD